MKSLIVFILTFGSTVFLYGQKDVVQFLQASEISTALIEEYIEPMAKLTNGNINTGWYHTAKTHRFLGFDISLSLAETSSSGSNRGFVLTKISDFETYYTLADGSSSATPNVSGIVRDLPVIKSRENGREIEMPNGTGLSKISLPVVSAGLGLPYNTELRLRFMPKLKNDELGDLMQYGVAIKHSIKEYFPGLKEVPAFSMSVIGAYAAVRNDISVEYPASVPNHQTLKGVSNGYTGRLLLGMDVMVFSAFMGVGYGVSSTEYMLKGNYFVGDLNNQEEVTDPVAVEYNYSQLEVNFGMSAKIGVFDIFADYTPGNYQTFNFGLGFNVR
ncbi:hypothetical protein E9993_13455 [Labilibacter sediminis]|nr:hypothetical protein E9993_13455 [Labilibacter sediminis]